VQAQVQRNPALGMGQGVGVSFTRQRGGSVEARLAQVNYGREIGRWGYVGAILLRDLGRGGSGTTVAFSWTLALDSQHSAGVNVQRQPDLQGRQTTLVQAQVQRNPALGMGLGYQVLAGSDGHQLAQATWQGEQSVLSGAVGRRGGLTEVRAGAAGGLAWVDGSAFAGRRIEGGLAVVDVGGHEGVRVTQDNQIVARTDAQGRAFLTSLRGYQTNRVGIQAGDLPMDAEVQAVEVQITPAARSAARIAFPVQHGRSASLQVFELNGEALPPGAELRPLGSSRSFPVGLGGRAYLGALAQGRNEVAAAWLDARGAQRQCRFDFTLPPPRGDDLPELGALICH
ncbi:fimbria/pilus outer membrane usher protein, partial [Roseateles puraquae]|uniref:fimbria/pilus outer membrane usher protein n=1 Tax=Roseateles puraquae TaxID=431059 RepID=UPI00240866D6